MSRLGWMGTLRAGTALGILIVAAAQANAGGFAIREQSTYGQGASFAGIAAGGALSSMFWNPATMTQFQGIVIENGVSAIIPKVNQTPQAGTFPALLALGGVSNSGEMGLVPNGYTSYQLSPNLWMGLSINAPFGLSVSFPDPWAGRNYSGDSQLRTYNATPSLAYRINDWISIGAGVQIQYAKAAIPLGPANRRLPGSYTQRTWLWFRLHGRCVLHADADDLDWHWLAFGNQSGHPWDDAPACRSGFQCAVLNAGLGRDDAQITGHRLAGHPPGRRSPVDPSEAPWNGRTGVGSARARSIS